LELWGKIEVFKVGECPFAGTGSASPDGKNFPRIGTSPRNVGKKKRKKAGSCAARTAVRLTVRIRRGFFTSYKPRKRGWKEGHILPGEKKARVPCRDMREIQFLAKCHQPTS